MKNYIKRQYKKGFTLIELLVVIAIIGILSAVVLASLNTARAKGADAAIKSDLANIRAQAELAYDNTIPNSYGTFAFGQCPTTRQGASAVIFDDPVVIAQIANASTASGNVANATCIGGGSYYVISVQLKANPALFWCVDNNGNSKVEGAQVASGALGCL
jgi:prepilin-type N-terminal cleavage/methylation domain-containing protein